MKRKRIGHHILYDWKSDKGEDQRPAQDDRSIEAEEKLSACEGESAQNETKPNEDSIEESSLMQSNERIQKLKDTVAAMGDDEYETKRKDLAREYGVRILYLDGLRPKIRESEVFFRGLRFDDPEPWPEEVDGATLLDDLVAIQRKYLVLPKGAAEAGALWILHGWAHNLATISPILTIVSPDKRCGKSTYVSLLTYLLPRVLPCSNATPAVVFRAVERYHPTLLLDELDTYLKNADDFRGILNSGHLRSQAFVLRNVAQGNGYEPKAFSTWAPKVFALIGNLPPTLSDRSIVVRLQRRRKTEEVDRLRFGSLDKYTGELRSKAFAWVRQNQKALREAEPKVPEMNDRSADNWRELIKIAHVAGGHWPRTARKTAMIFAKEEKHEEDLKVELLFDIRVAFYSRGTDRIGSSELQMMLAAMDDRPWADFKGRPITTRRIAEMLKPFGIKPDHGSHANSYSRNSFSDAWSRYETPNLNGSQESGHCQEQEQAMLFPEYESNENPSPRPRAGDTEHSQAVSESEREPDESMKVTKRAIKYRAWAHKQEIEQR